MGCVRVTVRGSKLLRRKQQAGQGGCADSSREPGCGLDFPQLPHYLLLILLLHRPEMLIPLLVHFKQLWGEMEVRRGKQSRTTESQLHSHQHPKECAVCANTGHTLPQSLASQQLSAAQGDPPLSTAIFCPCQDSETNTKAQKQ